ncbi:hypothetical protein VSU19_19785 [Verrucomicrobiales bacterium BCK34]|nr:hypothetical protein [Verrucomicrobiales bacterium BCK34]
MESSREILKQANGYFELEMFSQAWEIIESLPPAERTKSDILELRLRILTGLSHWQLGEQIAKLLVEAGDSERKTVARFYHAHARAMWQSGNNGTARKYFRRAVEAWLEVRREFDDDDLDALCKE